MYKFKPIAKQLENKKEQEETPKDFNTLMEEYLNLFNQPEDPYAAQQAQDEGEYQPDEEEKYFAQQDQDEGEFQPEEDMPYVAYQSQDEGEYQPPLPEQDLFEDYLGMFDPEGTEAEVYQPPLLDGDLNRVDLQEPVMEDEGSMLIDGYQSPETTQPAMPYPVSDDSQIGLENERLANEEKIRGQMGRPSSTTALERFGYGLGGNPFLQGVTFGFADEIAGRLMSLHPEIDYEEARDWSRTYLAEAKERNPKLALAAEIGGSVAGSFLMAGALDKFSKATGIAGQLTKGKKVVADEITGNTLANVGKAGLLGAADSALYGLGSSDEDGLGRLDNAAKFGALGGALGGGIAGAGSILKKIGQGGLGKVAGDAVTTPYMKRIRQALGFTDDVQEAALKSAANDPRILKGNMYDGVSRDAMPNPLTRGSEAFPSPKDIGSNKILKKGEEYFIDADLLKLLDNEILSLERRLAELLSKPKTDPGVIKSLSNELKAVKAGRKEMLGGLQSEGINPKKLREFHTILEEMNNPKISIDNLANFRQNLYKLAGKNKPSNNMERFFKDYYSEFNDAVKKRIMSIDPNDGLVTPEGKAVLENWINKFDADDAFKALKNLPKGAATADLASWIAAPATGGLSLTAKGITNPRQVISVAQGIDDVASSLVPKTLANWAGKATRGAGSALTSSAGSTTARGVLPPLLQDDSEAQRSREINDRLQNNRPRAIDRLPSFADNIENIMEDEMVMPKYGQQQRAIERLPSFEPLQDIGRQPMDSDVSTEEDFFRRLEAIRNRRLGR